MTTEAIAEIAMLYCSARQDWKEADDPLAKNYFQGKKDAFRQSLALIAETKTERDSWAAYQESSNKGYLTRLGAAEGKAQRAFELLEMLQVGERLTKREIKDFLDWHKRTLPKVALEQVEKEDTQ